MGRGFGAGRTAAIVLAFVAAGSAQAEEEPKNDPSQWFRIARPDDRVDVFTHYDRIFPVDRLTPSPRPRAYARDVKPLEATPYVFEGRESTVGDYMARANVNGLMALKGGKVVFEAYRNGVGPTTQHSLWSASKSYTITVLGVAVREGKIKSIDDPVETYAPQFKGTTYGPVSIRHVAMMSSGIQFFHDQGRPNRNDMYLALLGGKNLDDFAAERGPRVPPGTDFNYLATDTHVLSAVLRGAYGKRYADIVQEKLWTPAGFSSGASWSKHARGPEGVNFGHCCLQATLQDFAHLGQLYLDDLVVGGKPLTPKGWADLVTRPSAPFQEPGEKARGYAMQFWVPQGHQDESMALGAFGQILWVDRKRGVVVAQLAANGDKPPTDAEENAVFRAIVDAALRSQ
ncbi:serine hydrolase [Phenylobacterium sp. SCN 70-31]|uniref:serine hydrolase domain-containing protein n=1 Tax=Phenylobacterium sp. SCN 70-31 TaxID=1660129 RepID=UPI00086C8E50|nr:serine hydrolase [Phenylobacterium sp. SCN 70-31]ODT89414.1 MAG: hypothetical protein ABS78_04335 [Phenylobacterium sp. SCN 70-31]